MKFRYAVARYVPSLVREESLNVGVLIEDETGRIGVRFLGGISRIRSVYPDADAATIRLIRDHITREFPIKQGKSLFSDSSGPSLDDVVRSYQNTICISQPRVTLGEDIKVELEDLFNRLVAPPSALAPRPISAVSIAPARLRHRLEGWFEQRHLLGPHKYQRNLEVEGTVYPWTFDFGVRNGKTTLVQSLSLKGSLDQAMNRAALLSARSSDVHEAADRAVEVVAVSDDAATYRQPIEYLEQHDVEVVAISDKERLSARLGEPLGIVGVPETQSAR